MLGGGFGLRVEGRKSAVQGLGSRVEGFRVWAGLEHLAV